MIQPSFAYGYFDQTSINPEKEKSRGCDRQLHFPFPSNIKVFISPLSRRKQGIIGNLLSSSGPQPETILCSLKKIPVSYRTSWFHYNTGTQLLYSSTHHSSILICSHLCLYAFMHLLIVTFLNLFYSLYFLSFSTHLFLCFVKQVCFYCMYAV